MSTDVVFIDSILTSANVGPDCWDRIRPQPIQLSVYLHLQKLFLTAAGQSDNVIDSIDYSHLSKAIMVSVQETPDSVPFNGVDGLIDAVAEKALSLAGSAVAEVRVAVQLPKLILLAAGFSMDIVILPGGVKRARKAVIRDLTLPVIIGVNPPEREAKQSVIINIICLECLDSHSPIDYRKIARQVEHVTTPSSHLTLEKFVLEIIRVVFLSSESLESVTVRAQKPSASSVAHSNGVEMTRARAELELSP